jgi:hypothetical protein
LFLFNKGETWDNLDFRQLQVQEYEALGEEDILTKLPCYMTVIEGLSALLGYFNYPKALALGMDYVDSVYRISESYVVAGLLDSDAVNFFI